MPELPQVHNTRRTKHLTEVDRAKRNQAKRCYATSHPTWRKLRLTVLADEPLCRMCAKQGRVTPATDIDHIDGNTYNNMRTNHQPLCRPCHTRKTNAENGAGFR